MVKFKSSSEIKILVIPNKDLSLADKLVFSLRTGKMIRLSNHYVGLLLKNEFINMPVELIKILVVNELIVPAYEDESAEMHYKTELYHKDNEHYAPLAYKEITDQQILTSAINLRLI